MMKGKMLGWLSLVLLASSLVPALGSDEKCLQEFKASVDDPINSLSNWQFSNGSATLNLCNFAGVQCVHVSDNTVYKLKLNSMALGGSFPKGLSECTSLTSLDLSSNQFSGPLSETICTDVPYLVELDLNDNQFSGPIPDNLGNCSYLNYLKLEDNRLSGEIPASLGNLGRLQSFDVSNNDLYGQIPAGLTVRINDTSYFKNNKDLCGYPIDNRTDCVPSSKKSTGLIVGASIGAAVGVIIVVGFAVWWWVISRPIGYYSQRDENRWIKRIKAPKSIVVSMFEKPLVKIKLSDLMTATNDFSQANIIASGRTGTVYKGVLVDGSVMAIKRLIVTAHSDRQFRAEMETLGRLKHRNLVPLLGYCIAGPERLLVYKHMPNGTLNEHLRGTFKESPVEQVSSSQVTSVPTADVENGGHLGSRDEPGEVKKMEWETRLKIAVGTARGLAWLHHSCNPRVIHRNISPSSILLDEEFEPKISDFGLARLMNPVDTHISTFINGDFGDVGYVAPEYVRTLVATVKGDIYSFGVVLLELVTGQKAVDISGENFRGNLAEWVWYLTNKGNVGSAIDKSLLTGTDRDDELMQFLKIAASCVVPQAKERPSMYEVFHMLRAIGEKYRFTDQNDEIPLAPTTPTDIESPELIVSQV